MDKIVIKVVATGPAGCGKTVMLARIAEFLVAKGAVLIREAGDPHTLNSEISVPSQEEYERAARTVKQYETHGRDVVQARQRRRQQEHEQTQGMSLDDLLADEATPLPRRR